LPPYARLDRTLPPGEHALSRLLPGIAKSPALRRVEADPKARLRLLARSRVVICGPEGFAFVDVEGKRIILSERYYATGRDLDLYLDLLHELTHLRQLDQGFDLWDNRFEYVDRPTEVEAYSVAVDEGRRLGMSSAEVRAHLTNPWMTIADVNRLLGHIDRFLSGEPLPNIEQALVGAPFIVRHPWRCAKQTIVRAQRRPRKRMT
jgi:hypothetical protein